MKQFKFLQINFEKETDFVKNFKISDPPKRVPYEHKPFNSTLIKLVQETRGMLWWEGGWGTYSVSGPVPLA